MVDLIEVSALSKEYISYESNEIKSRSFSLVEDASVEKEWDIVINKKQVHNKMENIFFIDFSPIII